MNKLKIRHTVIASVFLLSVASCSKQDTRTISDFCNNWKFFPGDPEMAQLQDFPDTSWRILNLPHDWSIEGEFSETHPSTPGGGALPGGIGWYRKQFTLSEEDKGKLVFIDFDGVYMDSKVWINGYFLGRRPNGYISFRYELTPYLNYGDSANVIAVRVDNSLQPNSRWYSGSGIYRNVRLVKTGKVFVDHWGTYITTPDVTKDFAKLLIRTDLRNASEETKNVVLTTFVYNKTGKKIVSEVTELTLEPNSVFPVEQSMLMYDPELWSVQRPYLYKAVSQVKCDNRISDEYSTNFGVRFFEFDAEQGFLLNGEPVKIKGVCNHHDLGCLGAAVNTRALERQLEILKEMGCNGIRTSHNPPAPELLDLCDKMGFIVMDEAFDMWAIPKTKYDYSRFWNEWHERDLVDFMRRDRNHPSIFVWSVGNEILEQWDTSGYQMVQDLYYLARSVDSTRPITTANNPPGPENYLTKPMVVDLIGYNYKHNEYKDFPRLFPGQKFISTEASSSLATRGHYTMPSDSVRRWPYRWDEPFTDGEPGNTVSAYDHVSTPWGSTQEEVWKI
ncbi:MAG: glycoside hydrolase family 2 TIM barrel-domain containing protein, partial [Bacteroidales bacterium]